MTNQTLRTQFRNGILFCDLIGYSRLRPDEQIEAITKLNSAARGALASVGANLSEDVVALPTGDGLILNFVDREPDLPLRTALNMLSVLHGEHGPEHGLRLGLNSGVDTLVTDINGKRNVVGNVINLAQRVMDLGENAQVLMNERVREDLEAFPEISRNVFNLGEFVVKHGQSVRVAQYRDPKVRYLNNTPPRPSRPHAGNLLSLAEVVRERTRGEILSIEIPASARSALPIVQDHLVTLLDKIEAYQSLRVAASWIVGELLANAFEHGQLLADDVIVLRLDPGRHSLLIGVEQPARVIFDLAENQRNSAQAGSFFMMIAREGLQTHSAPCGDGNFVIEVELPLDYRPVRNTAFPQLDLPENSPVARTRLTRIDDGNWEDFKMEIMEDLVRQGYSNGPFEIDLSATQYISSRGLRTLMLIHRETGNPPISLRIASPVLSEIISIARFNIVFSIVYS